MGVHQQPGDVGTEIAGLKKEIEKLWNVVRRGKPAPNFRNLKDANLTKITDGQVPTYDAATGKMVPGPAGGASVAWLNNTEGAIGGSGGDFQQWDQLATRGETDWFEFPTEYWGPIDRAAFRFTSPGVFSVVARVTGSGLTSVTVTAGANGTIAEDTVTGAPLCGSGIFIAEQVEPADYQVLLIETEGADPVFSQVAVCFWPGEPAFTQF